MPGSPKNRPGKTPAPGLDRFPPWLVLDNHAKIWPAILSKRYTTLFRLSVILEKRVVVSLLQSALDSVMERFPYFRVSIRRGLFWYHLAPREDLPRVEADSRNPCMNHRIVGRKFWPFRVRVFNTRISLEITHIITDGTGALTFLHELVRRYLAMLDHQASGNPGLVDFGSEGPREEEWRDDYPLLHLEESRTLPRMPMREKAYHPPGILLPAGSYRVVSGWCPVAGVLALAKASGVSLTEYLVSATLMVLQEQQEEILAKSGRPWKSRPLIMNVPVNLRKIFPSKTLRNFFCFADPSIDPRLGHFTLEEIQEQVHHHMKFQVTPKRLRLIASRNLRSERKLAARLTPLFIKDLVLNLVFQGQGDQRFSASLSNLGIIPPLEGRENRALGMVFLPPPSPICKINVSALSYGDCLCITFAALIPDMDLARRFFTFLTARGVKVRIESNDPVQAAHTPRSES